MLSLKSVKSLCLAVLLGTGYLLLITDSYAADTLTVTTYYPSPYGSYRELRAQRMAVGNTYINNSVVCWGGAAAGCPGGSADPGAATSLVVEGNVGIGTTSPQQRLHVLSPSDRGPIFETYNGYLGCGGGGAGCDTEVYYRVARGTPTNRAAVQNGDEVTEWYAMGYDGNDWTDGLHLAFAVDGAVSPGNVPMKFEIRKQGDMPIFTAKQNGNVGIGTTDPIELINGASNTDADITMYTAANNQQSAFHGYRSRGTIAAPQIVQNGDYLATFLGYGYNGSGSWLPGNGTGMFVRMDGIPSLTSMPTTLSFATAPVGSITTQDRLTINNAGNVGIGTTNPGAQLDLSTDSARKLSTTTWDTGSDIRLKKDVRPFTDGLDVISRINPVWFKWNGKAGHPDDGKDNIGVIGQEIEKVAPYTVTRIKAKLETTDKNETELIDFTSHALIFALINAVKEQQNEIENLKSAVAELSKQLEAKQ